MPNYEFKNTETGEVFEKQMRISELDQYLIDNPTYIRHHSGTPVLSDGMRLSTPGTGKADSTFQKYIIDRIAETVPGNTIKQSHKTKTPREW